MYGEEKIFRPHPLLRNAHAQTLGAFAFPGRIPGEGAMVRIVDLFDGDQLVVHDDCPRGWRPGNRIALLLHGFCGNHQSPYVARLAGKMWQRQIRTFRIDFRGFGSSAAISRSHLYGGCSHDVESVIQEIHQLSPQSNLSVVGFSIGGNILMKLLGEWGEDYPQYVDQAIAVSPPVDLVYASWNIRSRGNQIYEAYFVNRLRKAMTLRRRVVKDLLDTGLKPLPDRLIEWDQRLIAPVWGFSDADDYYQQSSAGPLLRDVRVPSKILWAKDDPVVPIDSYQRFTLSNQIEIVETPHGGHLGFLAAKNFDPDRYWMDWRILEWIEDAERRYAGEKNLAATKVAPRMTSQNTF
jgi:predicted alpha/beta-fold hydrolase